MKIDRLQKLRTGTLADRAILANADRRLHDQSPFSRVIDPGKVDFHDLTLPVSSARRRASALAPRGDDRAFCVLRSAFCVLRSAFGSSVAVLLRTIAPQWRPLSLSAPRLRFVIDRCPRGRAACT
jgi:hypothetical protein